MEYEVLLNSSVEQFVLSEPVASWELNSHYYEARKTLLDLAIENDSTERGVKL